MSSNCSHIDEAEAVIDAEKTPGCIIVINSSKVQLLPSWIWKVYVPGARLEATKPFPPDGDHEKDKGEVPPETVTEADPLLKPYWRIDYLST